MAGENPILQKVGTGVVIYLERRGRSNLSEIGRELQLSYSHLYYVIRDLEQRGVVKTEKAGREKIVELTENGKMLADLLRQIRDILQGKNVKLSKEPTKKRKSKSKIEIYAEKIDKILEKYSYGGKISAKDARTLGRLRKLLLRTRPRNKRLSNLRKQILEKIGRMGI